MAVDLRTLVSAVKIVAEIERSADLAVNICKAARRLYGHGLDPRLRGLITRMAEQAQALYVAAIDSYVENDAAKAAAIDDMDSLLDGLQREFIQVIFESHAAGRIDLQVAVQLAVVARFYERIGDHAVNIGERVRYVVTGWLPEHDGAARYRARRERRTRERGRPRSRARRDGLDGHRPRRGGRRGSDRVRPRVAWQRAAARRQRRARERRGAGRGRRRRPRAGAARSCWPPSTRLPQGVVIVDRERRGRRAQPPGRAHPRRGATSTPSSTRRSRRTSGTPWPGRERPTPSRSTGRPGARSSSGARSCRVDGQQVGAMCTIEDVSERVRLDSVRTDLVANISHELKTPVGAIALLAETLADEDEPEVIARLAPKLIAEAERLSRIIDELLELSRIELGGQSLGEVVDVEAVVRRGRGAPRSARARRQGHPGAR